KTARFSVNKKERFNPLFISILASIFLSPLIAVSSAYYRCGNFPKAFYTQTANCDVSTQSINWRIYHSSFNDKFWCVNFPASSPLAVQFCPLAGVFSDDPKIYSGVVRKRDAVRLQQFRFQTQGFR